MSAANAVRPLEAWWRLLALAQRMAALEPTVSELEAATFVGIVDATVKLPFPLDYPLAQDLAGAFAKVAGRYVRAPSPEIRQGIAGFMAGGAACLEQLLDMNPTTAAPTGPDPITRRQFPGDWD